jgi:hypothetical protein
MGVARAVRATSTLTWKSTRLRGRQFKVEVHRWNELLKH